jgi:hypothetical protein
MILSQKKGCIMKKVLFTLATASVVLGLSVQGVSAHANIAATARKEIGATYKMEREHARTDFKDELKSAKSATDKKAARKAAIAKYKAARKTARDKMKLAKKALKPTPKPSPTN